MVINFLSSDKAIIIPKKQGRGRSRAVQGRLVEIKMKTLLQINSSLQGANSQSSRLANSFAEGFLSRNPGTTRIMRDLGADPIPHLDGGTFEAFSDPSAAVTSAQKSGLALSDTLIEELEAADVLVIGAPMYNFSIPSTLKAWIDHVIRAHVTFCLTEAGPKGLLHGKKAYVAIARGGRYLGTQADLQTAYLKMALGLIGITDVDFIYAEGLAMGPQAEETALKEAHLSIQKALEAVSNACCRAAG